ncbi:MAG: bifunctional adenosylcobinamide kinase/adenosylcobinamide-phosphate guanylyltransferase [Peptostreptococcaceae bacterium]|nr:bifunctional adenosylcobinamide kinase/adenosylcobinamide-phosphate guanylyltransferase [Peptostreptococcaceae bacterium]
MSKLIMVTGGSRSGKSCFSEKICTAASDRLAYIATAEAMDDEMAQRIKTHQERRGSSWTTFEIPINISERLDSFDPFDHVLLDCLTMLISNMMFSLNIDFEMIGRSEREAVEKHILDDVKKLLDGIRRSNINFVIVTNEIGLGIVPEGRLSRLYRDIVGKANQILASEADEVYFVVSGIPLKIKGCDPV